MRFDTQRGKTAYEIIKESSLDTMNRWFIDYADFSVKRAHTIASTISNHKMNPLLQTTQ